MKRAFSPAGRDTRIVLLDNLREGVLVPDIYDPAFNLSGVGRAQTKTAPVRSVRFSRE